MTVRVYSGDNPSQLYMDALMDLLNNGKETFPRGKRTLELRPVVFEYTNPLNRVTFLRGRVINPFFQLAEALWILAGRSDVEWLKTYNSNIASFSDDLKYFNAPYGERLRCWGKNDASNTIVNPHDQLTDIFKTLKNDPDTRQAYASIWNPHFDNGTRTTKDRACNVGIDFKIRDNKLDITVFNRSNDLHWGTFGANLCQFATIQEAMASWLDIEVGNYYQITNGLHIYMDDYGSKETDKILKAYGIGQVDDRGVDRWVQMQGEELTVPQFVFDTEPRMSTEFTQFHTILHSFFTEIDPLVPNMGGDLMFIVKNIPDDYLRMSITAMLAYREHKKNLKSEAIECLKNMVDCSWKVSCLRFLSKGYLSDDKVSEDFRSVYSHLSQDIIDYIERKGEGNSVRSDDTNKG